MFSSEDLHPKQGARFVFQREGEAPLNYHVEVYLPETRRIDTRLRWEPESGAAVVEPAVEDAAVLDQLIKLARVLKRTAAARLTRWRDVP